MRSDVGTAREMEYTFDITALEPDQSVDHILYTTNDLPSKQDLPEVTYNRIVRQLRRDDTLTKMIVFRESLYFFQEYQEFEKSESSEEIQDALFDASDYVFLAIDQYIADNIREMLEGSE